MLASVIATGGRAAMPTTDESLDRVTAFVFHSAVITTKPADSTEEPTMPTRLYNKDTGAVIGDITEAQLDALIDLLEEEDASDHDYYFDVDTLELLVEAGVDEALVALLRPHVEAAGEDEGIEVQWRSE